MKARVGVLNIFLLLTSLYIATEIFNSFDDENVYCLSIVNPVVVVLEGFQDTISTFLGGKAAGFYVDCVNSYIFSLGLLSFIAVNIYDTRLITLGAL
jgi:hypothetical protein